MRPMYRLGISLFCGMMAASCFSGNNSILFGILVSLVGVVALAIPKGQWRKFGIWIFVVGIAAGYFGMYQFLVYQPIVRFHQASISLSGVITEKYERGTYRSYLIRVDYIEDKRVPISFLLEYQSESPLNCDYYDRVTYEGVVSSSSNTDGYSLSENQKSKGIFLEASDRDGTIAIQKRNSFSLQNLLLRLRDSILSSTDQYIPEPENQLTAGILFGQTDGIEFATLKSIRHAGFSHILAVSGLHVTIWVQGISLLLRACHFSRKKRNAICIGFVLVFSCMAGATPSILRAGIMAIISLGGVYLERRADALNSLGVAASVLLLLSPFSIMNLSFLLSFGATLGILLLMPKMKKLFHSNSRVVNYLIEGVCISASATVGTIPVVLLAFSELCWFAPFSNLLLIPFAELALFLGMLTGIVGCIPFLGGVASLLGRCAGAMNWMIVWISSLFDFVPAIPLGNWNPEYWLFLVTILSLFAWFCRHYKYTNRILSIGICLMFLIQTSISIFLVQCTTSFAVFAGPYSSCAAVCKGGHAVLFRCGGYGLEHQIYQYLESQGVYTIDLIFSDSSNRSAAYGIPFMLNQIEVKALVIPEDGTVYSQIVAAANEFDSKILHDIPSKIQFGKTNIQMKLEEGLWRLENEDIVITYGQSTELSERQETKMNILLTNQEKPVEPMKLTSDYGIIITDSTIYIQQNDRLLDTKSDFVVLRKGKSWFRWEEYTCLK